MRPSRHASKARPPSRQTPVTLVLLLVLQCYWTLSMTSAELERGSEDLLTSTAKDSSGRWTQITDHVLLYGQAIVDDSLTGGLCRLHISAMMLHPGSQFTAGPSAELEMNIWGHDMRAGREAADKTSTQDIAAEPVEAQWFGLLIPLLSHQTLSYQLAAEQDVDGAGLQAVIDSIDTPDAAEHNATTTQPKTAANSMTVQTTDASLHDTAHTSPQRFLSVHAAWSCDEAAGVHVGQWLLPCTGQDAAVHSDIDVRTLPITLSALQRPERECSCDAEACTMFNAGSNSSQQQQGEQDKGQVAYQAHWTEQHMPSNSSEHECQLQAQQSEQQYDGSGQHMQAAEVTSAPPSAPGIAFAPSTTLSHSNSSHAMTAPELLSAPAANIAMEGASGCLDVMTSVHAHSRSPPSHTSCKDAPPPAAEADIGSPAVTSWEGWLEELLVSPAHQVCLPAGLLAGLPEPFVLLLTRAVRLISDSFAATVTVSRNLTTAHSTTVRDAPATLTRNLTSANRTTVRDATATLPRNLTSANRTTVRDATATLAKVPTSSMATTPDDSGVVTLSDYGPTDPTNSHRQEQRKRGNSETSANDTELKERAPGGMATSNTVEAVCCSWLPLLVLSSALGNALGTMLTVWLLLSIQAMYGVVSAVYYNRGQLQATKQAGTQADQKAVPAGGSIAVPPVQVTAAQALTAAAVTAVRTSGRVAAAVIAAASGQAYQSLGMGGGDDSGENHGAGAGWRRDSQGRLRRFSGGVLALLRRSAPSVPAAAGDNSSYPISAHVDADRPSGWAGEPYSGQVMDGVATQLFQRESGGPSWWNDGRA